MRRTSRKVRKTTRPSRIAKTRQMKGVFHLFVQGPPDDAFTGEDDELAAVEGREWEHVQESHGDGNEGGQIEEVNPAGLGLGVHRGNDAHRPHHSFFRLDESGHHGVNARDLAAQQVVGAGEAVMHRLPRSDPGKGGVEQHANLINLGLAVGESDEIEGFLTMRGYRKGEIMSGPVAPLRRPACRELPWIAGANLGRRHPRPPVHPYDPVLRP